MGVDLGDVREVVTCRKAKANRYLDAGYRLLAVEHETVWTKPPKDVRKVEGYVLKHLTFCLGRPGDVEPFDPGQAAGRRRRLMRHRRQPRI